MRINGIHFLLLSISRARQVFVTMTSKSSLTLLSFFLIYCKLNSSITYMFFLYSSSQENNNNNNNNSFYFIFNNNKERSSLSLSLSLSKVIRGSSPPLARLDLVKSNRSHIHLCFRLHSSIIIINSINLFYYYYYYYYYLQLQPLLHSIF